jgi:hypothetical protein
MKEYRTLRAALCIYDWLRLLLMISILTGFGALQSAGEGSEGIAFVTGGVPFLVCTAPNALFPLMSLFLWLRFHPYRIYIPLYIAGKVIVLAALGGWLFFLLQSNPFSGTVSLRWFLSPFREMSGPVLQGFLFFIADALSILGMAVLKNRVGAEPVDGGDPVEEVPGNTEFPGHGPGL